MSAHAGRPDEQHGSGGVTLLASLLWLLVLAGLAYGIEETVRKAAALFTG